MNQGVDLFFVLSFLSGACLSTIARNYSGKKSNARSTSGVSVVHLISLWSPNPCQESLIITIFQIPFGNGVTLCFLLSSVSYTNNGTVITIFQIEDTTPMHLLTLI